MTDLVWDFDNRWRPLIKLIYPVWKSAVKKKEARFSVEWKYKHDKTTI